MQIIVCCSPFPKQKHCHKHVLHKVGMKDRSWTTCEPVLTVSSPVHLQLRAGRRASCCGYRCLPLSQLWCCTRTLPEWVLLFVISGMFPLLFFCLPPSLPPSILTRISFIKHCPLILCLTFKCLPLFPFSFSPPTPVPICWTGPRGKGPLSLWSLIFFFFF